MLLPDELYNCYYDTFLQLNLHLFKSAAVNNKLIFKNFND